MCGRYAASRHRDQLVEVFEVDEVVEADPAAGRTGWDQPRWNIAPTDEVAAIVERAHEDAKPVRKLVGLHWGLVPSWSKDSSGSARMINARLETVAEKPSFRKAFRSRRCLIPADGYYEWYSSPGQVGGATSDSPKGRTPKQPFFIHPTDTDLMAMAGIYEFWKSPEGEWLSSCAIITTEATDDLGRIHDRMPVQVESAHWDAWLDPAITDAEAALALAHVPTPGQMTAHPVSRLVSNVRNDGPELIQPLPFEEELS